MIRIRERPGIDQEWSYFYAKIKFSLRKGKWGHEEKYGTGKLC